MATRIVFAAVPIGAMFSCNGVVYQKRSSRTADSFRNGWFWFRQNDCCELLS